MIKLFIFIFPLFFLLNCIIEKSDINEISDVCGTDDLEALKNQNTVNEECKNAIQDLLPQPENNISNRLFYLGQGTVDNNVVLFCSGTDNINNLLTADAVSNTTVEEFRNQQKSQVDTSHYMIKKLADFSGIVISLSSIIDYSGSMSDQDIDDAIEIFSDLFMLSKITNKFETDIIIFSDTVKLAMDFTSDNDTINKYIARDNGFHRGSTQLFDAIGTGFTGLPARNSLIKILIVATDGMENASKIYQKEQLFNLSHTHNIPVVILGALFADLEFMRETAEETGGIYIYSKTILNLKNEFLKFGEMLENSIGIEFSSNFSSNLPDSISITVDDKNLIYRF